MKRLIQCFSVLLLVLVAANVQAQEKTLFFSQYIEGSSQNKAFEIFNPTDAAIDLGDYIVLGNFNGNPFNDTLRFPAGTMLESLDVYVVAHEDADAAITAVADSLIEDPFADGTSFIAAFNGDDSRALYHISGTDTTLLDIFATPDEDPGSGWDVAGVENATANHTLVRLSRYQSGNNVPLASFGPDSISSEWMVLDQNDFTGLGSHTVVEPKFTLRDFNFYRNQLTELTETQIISHPLFGESRTFTAVLVSYPKSSGLATPRTDDEGNVTSIDRIHVFVSDTSAIAMGREGMSAQLVESDYEIIDGYRRGAVLEITGRLTNFGSTTQVTVDEVTELGSVDDPEFSKFKPLLDPWVIPLSEINTFDNESNSQVGNVQNYWKYNGVYAKIQEGVVTNTTPGDRPFFAINADGSRMYTYDTSLRYRNDRVEYLDTYNFRQDPDPVYAPPAPGSVINLSGFLSLNGTPLDGTDGDWDSFLINPFEDGAVWLNGTRFEDGDDLGGGLILDWPNDLELLGQPPVFSNVFQSDSAVTSSESVTITATVVGVDGKTVTGVNLTYIVGGVSETVAMTADGDDYSAAIPSQANFTPVTFFLEATDSDGLVGRGPLSGNYGYFVQDGAINTIALIQETSDGGPGASALVGAGIRPMDITATIVSDNNDGVIVLQEQAGPWSGIFLERVEATNALERGDEITVTAAEVIEASVASSSNASIGLTQLINVEFSVNSSGNDIEPLIPVIRTDSIDAWAVNAEIEPYEGMVVKFEDVQVVERGNFGEFNIQNIDANTESVAIYNEDIRSDDQIGSVGSNTFDFNHTIRLGKTMDTYAIVAASFGAPKFHPRNADDFVTEDGNAFTPDLTFGLLSPADSATVEVTGDIEVSWSATEDFDGDDVTYAWALYNAADTSFVVELSSNNEGADALITIPGTAVDDLLAGAGLEVGQSADFVWNVKVSDGSDTLGVHGSYGNFGDDFMPIYRFITLQRGIVTSNDVVTGVPSQFNLEQNYPNPFNPSTNINFALPQASNVILTVYDMLGRKVATLIDGERLQAANHSVRFNASALASGMYIYRIEAGSFVSTRKMMLIK